MIAARKYVMLGAKLKRPFDQDQYSADVVVCTFEPTLLP